MKKLICSCLILLISISLALTKAKAQLGARNSISALAEAERAWTPFWSAFKTAIRQKNTEVLKTMLSRDYEGNFCERTPADGRDGFVCRGWGVLYKEFFNRVPIRSQYRLSKIDKLADERIGTFYRSWDSKNSEWGGYVFTFMPDKKWYLSSFVTGCTA